MKLSLLQWSVLANLVLLVATVVLGWQLAQAKPECRAQRAEGVIAANDQQRADEGKRDEKLDKVDTTTKADTRKAVGKVERETHARAEAIDRVPAGGGCAAPVGLPDLGPAVDAANAAAGE